MRTIFRTACMLLAGAALLASCKEKEEVTYYMTADKTAISDVAANNPSDETLVLKTNAATWLVLTPDWVSATPNSGEGNENGTVITLKIASNYKNETTDTAPRSGVLKFSGSGQTLEIPISQNGHTAVVYPNASIGGIPDMAETPSPAGSTARVKSNSRPTSTFPATASGLPSAPPPRAATATPPPTPKDLASKASSTEQATPSPSNPVPSFPTAAPGAFSAQPREPSSRTSRSLQT